MFDNVPTNRLADGRVSSRWAGMSGVVRRRYRRLIAYHVRRALRRYPGLSEADLDQEIEAAIWAASSTWQTARASRMQYSTYLHWHLTKQLARLREDGVHSVSMDADLAEHL